MRFYLAAILVMPVLAALARDERYLVEPTTEGSASDTAITLNPADEPLTHAVTPIVEKTGDLEAGDLVAGDSSIYPVSEHFKHLVNASGYFELKLNFLGLFMSIIRFVLVIACRIFNIPNNQYVESSICRILNMSNPQNVEASIRRIINTSKHQYVEASICPICRNINMSKHQYAEASICRSINMSKHQYVEPLICGSNEYSNE